jgi:hypothetical protein
MYSGGQTEMNLDDYIRQVKARREKDARRYAELDEDTCMLCNAQGPDMRSLFVSCFYSIEEVLPEAISMHDVPDAPDPRAYYLRICKTCRASFLSKLAEWWNERSEWRDIAKDSDGSPEICYGTIPVRINGAIVMMSEEQYEEYQRRCNEGK